MFETKNTRLIYLLLLIFIYLFSFFDLVLTAYLTLNYGTGELNPLYHIGGWDLLIVFKLIVPALFYILSIRAKTLLPLTILLSLMIGTCYWNALVWLSLYHY